MSSEHLSHSNSSIIGKPGNFFHRIFQFIGYILEGNKKNSVGVLDGVRAVAILTVVFYHISVKASLISIPWINYKLKMAIYNGYAGVTLFLVLSGFLLFLPYSKSLLFDNDWPSVRSFYLRRALRIIPGYYLTLFLVVMLAGSSYLQPIHWKELALFLVFFMDSSQKTFQHLDAPFWTLAVEWQFYMVLPWIALAMRFFVQKGSLRQRIWKLVACLCLLVLWGVTTRYYGNIATQYPNNTHGLPATVFRVIVALTYGCGGIGIHGKFMEDFAVGMIVAVIYTLARNSMPNSFFNRFLRLLSPWLFLGSLGWLFAMVLWSNGGLFPNVTNSFTTWFYGDGQVTFHELGFAIGYATFMFSILFGGKILTRIFEWNPLRWIGLISFSIYMWHIPLLLPFADNIAPYIQTWSPFRVLCLQIAWFFLVICPFSFIFFALVERPFMKYSESLRKKKPSLTLSSNPNTPSPQITAKREVVSPRAANVSAVSTIE
ncbi:acyltransferase family protein [Tengunoibacter tsumagoiensis]|uniref:Acyltransferase n=1 Tax=Tengunoibacter tsumagoiensis TaxID=2014871 RepID=A0A402A4N3_9CHLR|nr:acyltransferase [Tengunoibacter tsumagoiensis]GCE14108.1 acyltransferase [Tengunoibacter tsumagoiensis]